jgi:hypothetical protein
MGVLEPTLAHGTQVAPIVLHHGREARPMHARAAFAHVDEHAAVRAEADIACFPAIRARGWSSSGKLLAPPRLLCLCDASTGRVAQCSVSGVSGSKLARAVHRVGVAHAFGRPSPAVGNHFSGRAIRNDPPGQLETLRCKLECTVPARVPSVVVLPSAPHTISGARKGVLVAVAAVKTRRRLARTS